MGIHYDYKSFRSAKLMEKKAKREKKLAEKRARKNSKSEIPNFRNFKFKNFSEPKSVFGVAWSFYGKK